MKWVRRLFDTVREWFRTGFQAICVPDLPDKIAPNIVYLVGDDEPWQAAFLCPCGCRAIIQLSLVAEDKPSWSALLHPDQTVTLFPSVWRKRGCKAHFFVRRGRIVWTHDSGR